MNEIGKSEQATQDRVIAIFQDELGYRFLGDWTDHDDNSNIEGGLLSAWLTQSSYTPAQISAALHTLRTEADNHSRTLYGNKPSRLQPAAPRRACEDRGGQGDGNRPPRQLAGAGAERLCHRR